MWGIRNMVLLCSIRWKVSLDDEMEDGEDVIDVMDINEFDMDVMDFSKLVKKSNGGKVFDLMFGGMRLSDYEFWIKRRFLNICEVSFLFRWIGFW